MTTHEGYEGSAAPGAQDIRLDLPRRHSPSRLDAQAIERFAAVRADAYTRHFQKLEPAADIDLADPRRGRLPFAPSWCWPAFALTVPWMFYRKMYTGGIILVALPIILDNLLPGSIFLGSGLLIAVVAGICAKSWYLDHVANRIAKAGRQFADESDRNVYIGRARGVSLAGGVFGVLIQIVSGTVIVLNLLPPNHY